jgi:hypothetical protein
MLFSAPWPRSRPAYVVETTTLLLAIGGCRSLPPTPSPAAVRPLTSARTRQDVSVQQNPDYKKAVTLFQMGDFPAARSAIAGLLKDPHLSRPDAEFLDRQLVICDSKLRPVTQSPSHRVTVSAVRLGDCGPRALQIIFRKLGNEASLGSLAKSADTASNGTSMEGLAKAARKLGFKVDGIQVDVEALNQLHDPAVAWTNGNHYIAVLSVSGDSVIIHDPNKDTEEVIAAEELIRRSGGILLTVSRK